MSLEIAIISTIFAVGGILLGHFEERTSKWKRLGKLAAIMGMSLLISMLLGRAWFFVFLAINLGAVLALHLWWLPRNGIHGWSGEPKEAYYRLRGWDDERQDSRVERKISAGAQKKR